MNLSKSLVKLLPNELVMCILSFLSNNEIHLLALKKILNKDITLSTYIYKFPFAEKRILKGLINNYFDDCFKCSKKLALNHNLIMCPYCSIVLEENYNYPIICHNCSRKKLNRGQYNFSSCDICGKLTAHLGITYFS